MPCALIFANGQSRVGPMVERALVDGCAPLVIAADGGAYLARRLGLRVDAVIGDMDSIQPEYLAELAAGGAVIRRFPAEKDATDLELALYYAREIGAEQIRIVGGIGDRMDQTLANLHLLALPVLSGCDVRLVDGRQEIRLLSPGTHEISGQADDTVSLIPIGGAVEGIITEGLYYPLRDESLLFGPARGVSNVMLGTTAQVTTRAGLLLMIHSDGRP